MGKKIIPRTNKAPSKSNNIPNENPNIPAKMLTKIITIVTMMSLNNIMKIKRRVKRMNSNNFKGAFTMQPNGLLQNY